jgi:hypothetical protein
MYSSNRTLRLVYSLREVDSLVLDNGQSRLPARVVLDLGVRAEHTS